MASYFPTATEYPGSAVAPEWDDPGVGTIEIIGTGDQRLALLAVLKEDSAISVIGEPMADRIVGLGFEITESNITEIINNKTNETVPVLGKLTLNFTIEGVLYESIPFFVIPDPYGHDIMLGTGEGSAFKRRSSSSDGWVAWAVVVLVVALCLVPSR